MYSAAEKIMLDNSESLLINQHKLFLVPSVWKDFERNLRFYYSSIKVEHLMHRYSNQENPYVFFNFPGKIMFEESHNFISFDSLRNKPI